MSRRIKRIQEQELPSLVKGTEMDVVLKNGATFHAIFLGIEAEIVSFKSLNKTKHQYPVKAISEIIVSEKV